MSFDEGACSSGKGRVAERDWVHAVNATGTAAAAAARAADHKNPRREIS